MTWLRRVPIDVWACLAIALLVVVSHVPVIRTGMCFNDPAWLFHFGNKTLHGAVPYKDYVWQVGPLPIYVDATFQQLFGERYVASLFAAMLIKILRISVVWMLARRLAGTWAAVGLAVFCVLDPLFAFAHHWSTPYAELSITLAGLFALLATRSTDTRRAMIYFGLAGAAAATVILSRQSSWVLVSLVLLASTTLLAIRNDERVPRRGLVMMWIGFAGVIALFVAMLAFGGALRPAIQQMFVDGPQKKGIHGLDAVLDAISGGALVDGRFAARWRGFLFFIGLPIAASVGAIWLTAKEIKISSATLALLVIPVLTVIGLLSRDASFELTTDLPRTFLSLIGGLAVLDPARTRRWFGIEPLLVVFFGTIALASDWALEMSFPGRGWGDIWALVMAVILLALASSHLTARIKTWICAALAAAAIAHAGITLWHGFNPFAKPEASDGTLAENDYAPHVQGKRSPVLRGLRIPLWRSLALEWMGEQVTPGSTCFVYANLPSLYDLLDCKNPTKIDTTIADFPSAANARDAVAAMKANPPDFIIAHDKMWMSPSISLDLEGDIHRYDSWNPKASFALHMGLRSIIDQYESLGTVGEALGPVYAAQAANHWDVIDAIHIYRRKQ